MKLQQIIKELLVAFYLKRKGIKFPKRLKLKGGRATAEEIEAAINWGRDHRTNLCLQDAPKNSRISDQHPADEDADWKRFATKSFFRNDSEKDSDYDNL
jgi:hypothetical protein